MKIRSFTTPVIVSVMLLCALSTGGRQSRQTPSMRSQQVGGQRQEDYVCNKDKTTLPVSLPASAFPDFNVIGSLPPGVMVRWDDDPHPDEIAFSRIVSKVPTVPDKLLLLACMAESLQAEVSDLKHETANVEMLRARIGSLEKHSDELANVVNAAGTIAASADNGGLMVKNQLDDLKRELDDFKEAVCPVLRTARMGDITRMKLDSACGLH